MKKFWERVKVVWRAAPTWLTGASVVVGVVAEEIADVLPAGAAEDVGHVALVVVAWLGAAIGIIRRVTPVPPEERGILPPT